MARLRSKRTLLLSKDSTETNQVFEKVQRDDELTDAYVKASSIAPLTLLPSASQAVNFQGISPVKYLYIESDSLVNVSLNGGTALPCTPQNNTATVPSAIPGKWELWTDNITSLTISNPSVTATAKVTVVFAGG